MARLLVFGSVFDPQVTHVLTLAKQAGHEIMAVEPERWMGTGVEPHAIRIDNGISARFGGEDPLCADGAWVRHLVSPFIRVDTASRRPLDREEVFVAVMNAQERAAAVLSIVDALIADGKTVINPPAVGIGIQNKPTQLMAVARAGVRVPATLITDDPDSARQFAKGRNVIFKPVAGGALARRLDNEAAAGLDMIVRAPVIFQERVEGDDVRVTMVDDEIVSCVAIETPEGTLDFRSDEAYASGKGTYREVALPGEIIDAVRTTRRVLGLRFCGIDVRLDADAPEAYAVLEANPSPTYLDVERKMGHPISERLLQALLRR